MDRRAFFAATMSVLGFAGIAPADDTLRKVWRKQTDLPWFPKEWMTIHFPAAPGEQWQEVRMKDLVVGDLVMIEDLPGAMRVTHQPKLTEDGVWGIMTEPT